MRSITTTSGTEIVLDGDLLAVLEALYHEVTARKELERSFEDLNREINHLINQLTDDERRVESVLLGIRLREGVAGLVAPLHSEAAGVPVRAE